MLRIAETIKKVCELFISINKEKGITPLKMISLSELISCDKRSVSGLKPLLVQIGREY